jgi:predicted adenylyl cyclase CyaB
MSENVETEVKIPVEDTIFETSRVALKRGVQLDSFLLEENIFYKTPEGFLRLRKYDQQISVTYKGERTKSETINSREEIEFDEYCPEEFDKLKTFFSRLGLKRDFEYTKQRLIYRFDQGIFGDHNCAVSFDILPNGDKYIEIEELVSEGIYSPASTGKTIENVVRTLGLQNYPREKRNYLEIVMGDKNEKTNCI